MDTATAVRVAEALADEIRQHTFTLAPDVVERGYTQDLHLELRDADGVLRVDVKDAGINAEAFSADMMAYKCRMDVVIRKRFSDTEIDTDTGKSYSVENYKDSQVLRIVK